MVEILVALAIFTFGAAGAYQHYLDTSRQAARQVEQAKLSLLAHQEIEQLRACRFDRLAAWTTPAGPVPLKEDIAYLALYQKYPRPDGALELTVQVWRSQQDNTAPPPGSVKLTGVMQP